MIDWTRAAELRDEIGADVFPEVLTMFLGDTEEAIDRMMQQGASEHALHDIKGSAMTVGFAELAGLCQQGESDAARGRAHAVDVTALDRSFCAARAYFLQEMAARLQIAMPGS